jgi:hypothetical protein
LDPDNPNKIVRYHELMSRNRPFLIGLLDAFLLLTN